MAGTLQLLNLNPSATGTSPSRRLIPCFHEILRLSFCHRSFRIGHNSSPLSNLRHIPRRPITASGQFQPINGGQDQPRHVPVKANWGKPLVNFLLDNFLPLALIGGVALGLANPSLGCLADRYYLSKVGTFGIFIISGLTLRSEEIGAAVDAWPVGLFGLVSILLLTPFFSKIILLIRMQPQEFVTGLAMFSCMPTTLSSGVALTRLAGGNSALALAMTVISNLLGILTVPLAISKFIASGVGVSVPTEQLFRSLVLTLLIPVILGKALRELFRGVAEFADKNRNLLSMISAICLSVVPWIQVSKSQSLLLMVKPAVFLIAVGMGVVLHLMLLASNILATQCLSAISGGRKSLFANKQNARALLLVASQKTLPVLVAVVEPLGSAFGETGLLLLPCVAAHLNQIIMDSFFVSFWAPKEPAIHEPKAA